MARFDRMIKTAERLVAKNGQMVTWRQPRPAEALPDAQKPWKPADQGEGGNTEYSVMIAFVPDTRQFREFQYYMRDSELKSGVIIGLMAGSVPFAPSNMDVVIRDGVEYRINDIQLISPNGQKILYKVEFKG